MAVCQLAYSSLTHRHRGQAPSHIWISNGLEVFIQHLAYQ